MTQYDGDGHLSEYLLNFLYRVAWYMGLGVKTKKRPLFSQDIDIIPSWEYNIGREEMLALYNIKYISAIEAAERWSLSRRRVITLCNSGRIKGAQKAGSYWIIPENAEKPSDARIKSGRYIGEHTTEKIGKKI